MLDAAGFAPLSHSGKALMDILETYPRDELFQTPVDELLPDRRGGAPHPRAPPAAAVRAPRRLRPLHVLPGLPAARPLHHRGARADAAHPKRQLGGESVDYTARVSESVLARLHFVVRAARGEHAAASSTRRPRAPARRGHPVLERRPRRGGARASSARRRAPGWPAHTPTAFPEAYKEDFAPRTGAVDLGRLETLEGEEGVRAVPLPADRRRAGRGAAQGVPRSAAAVA